MLQPVAPATRRYVLRLPVGEHVNHGRFWPQPATPAAISTYFWWEFWICPHGTALGAADASGYFISDGYGGAHSILAGFSGADGDTTPGAISGNIWNGSGTVTFGSIAALYAVNSMEWVHVILQYRQGRIWVKLNGIICGHTNITGTVRTSYTGSPAILFLNGSDHLMLGADYALLRAWDRRDPLNGLGTALNSEFPTRFPTGRWGRDPADILVDYTQRGSLVDQSERGAVDLDTTETGYDALAAYRRHNGTLYGSAGILQSYEPQSPPTPTQGPNAARAWVADSRCPLWNPEYDWSPNERTYAASALPSGAVKIFHDFSGPNSTAAFQSAPTLGPSDSRALLPSRAFSQGQIGSSDPTPRVPGNWAKLGGWARCTCQSIGIGWWANDSADLDARVLRVDHADVPTGLAFRVQDRSNWLAIIYSRWNARLELWECVNNSVSTLQTQALATTGWNWLRVVTSGTTITVYTGNGASQEGLSWTQRLQRLGVTTHQAQVGVGLASVWDAGFSSSDGQAAYGQFTVY